MTWQSMQHSTTFDSRRGPFTDHSSKIKETKKIGCLTEISSKSSRLAEGLVEAHECMCF
jgi:hypothetical protein